MFMSLPFLRSSPLRKVAMFWDWISLFQNYYAGTSHPPDVYHDGLEYIERDEGQQALFKVALNNLNDWYMSSKTYKFLGTPRQS